MNRQIFISMAVADVAKSMVFFEALGFLRNPQFMGDTAGCVVISETISVMLCSPATFGEFSPKPACDMSKAAEVLLAIACESQSEVDDMIAKASDAGAIISERGVDYGFMYHSSFADPDGHLWALNYTRDTPPQT